MARSFAALLAALLVWIPAHATLAGGIPTRDGIVGAADSRLTFMGSQCDGAFKILIPAQPTRTAIIVTGDAFFMQPQNSKDPNPCERLASAPRFLDIGSVVTEYLERGAPDPANLSLADLAAACVHATERFQQSYPAALRAYTGKDIYSVVLASYDPVKLSSTLRNFVVRINPQTRKPQAARFTSTTYGSRDRGGVFIYGETAWVGSHVYIGYGRQFISPPTLDFIHTRVPIFQVPLNQALATAADLLHASIRTAQSAPPPHGIGGPIRIVLLGSNPMAEESPLVRAVAFSTFNQNFWGAPSFALLRRVGDHESKSTKRSLTQSIP